MEASTKLISTSRNEIIPVGGYGQYRKFCSQKLLHIRRSLKIVTPKGRKYEKSKITEISAEDYARHSEWREYLLFSAERAWAHAMDTKSLNAADSGEVTLKGPVRNHVLSRLAKAVKVASHLAHLSRQHAASRDDVLLLLAHGAYWRLLEGAMAFEGHRWDRSVRTFSESQVLYTALADRESGGPYRDWISDNVEPSIRYAAYRLKLPRTLAVPNVVARFVDRDSSLVQKALEVSPQAIATDQPSAKTDSEVAKDLREAPSEITWRGRTVKLEDARIAQALGAVKRAEEALASGYEERANGTAIERAAAYDDILGKSQDAADAAKGALDELAAEGVRTDDQRMQNLQVTRTAVSYDAIGWRIGRNRVLCGNRDGLELEEEAKAAPKGRKSKKSSDSVGKQLARLRSRVVLYDATLDSLSSIRELPGIAADQNLSKKIASRKAYFSALRSLTIARSHALLGNSKNALALLTKAADSAGSINTTDDDESGSDSPIPRHYLTSEVASLAKKTIEGLKLQHQALVELDRLNEEATKIEKAKAAWSCPLIERLEEYPPGGADLSNLVSYPPKLQPVPVNPIFLDVAWNYIDYPGRKRTVQQGMSDSIPDADQSEEQTKPTKKGWFSFGRS